MIKGSKHTPESIAKQSEAHKRNPTGFKLGHKHSVKTIEKIRLAITGRKYGRRNNQWRENISKGKKGVKFSDEHRKNLSLAHIGIQKGDKSPNWKGGISPLNHQIRNSFTYIDWRRKVLKRDKWSCVVCGYRSKGSKPTDIHADHIKSFAKYPKLRFMLSNGQTLCIPCHSKTESYKRK